MKTPLPKARLLAALLTLTLTAGCQGTQFSGGGKARSSSNLSTSLKPATRLVVAGRNVVIPAPKGYCIDKNTSVTRPDIFVLLASCSAISQSPAHPSPDRKGLFTVTVGRAGSGNDPIDPDGIARYFRSAEGRAALSDSGSAQSVRIHGAQISGSAFYVFLSDSAPPRSPELGQARWRAFFTLNGRFVSAVLYSFAFKPIERDAGFNLLQSFVERILAESRP